MAKDKLYKPGEKVPCSAQAEIVGPRGGKCFLQVLFPGFCKQPFQQHTQGILRIVFH